MEIIVSTNALRITATDSAAETVKVKELGVTGYTLCEVSKKSAVSVHE